MNCTGNLKLKKKNFKNPRPWKSVVEYKYPSKLTNKFSALKRKLSLISILVLCLSSYLPVYWESFLVMLSYQRYQGDIWQPVSNLLCFLREVAFALSLTQNWRHISALVCVRACHKGCCYILKANLRYSALPHHPGISGWLKRLRFNCLRFSTCLSCFRFPQASSHGHLHEAEGREESNRSFPVLWG